MTYLKCQTEFKIGEKICWLKSKTRELMSGEIVAIVPAAESRDDRRYLGEFLPPEFHSKAKKNLFNSRITRFHKTYLVISGNKIYYPTVGSLVAEKDKKFLINGKLGLDKDKIIARIREFADPNITIVGNLAEQIAEAIESEF